jgi:phage terminase large subunit-like protein
MSILRQRPTSLTASYISSLPEPAQARALASLLRLSPSEKTALLYNWAFWRRPLVDLGPDAKLKKHLYGGQVEPPGDWFVWLILAGRGYGKTRVGAETVNTWANSGRYGRIGLIGRTAADVRDVMVEGESGILASAAPWQRPKYEPSKRRLTWPNGARATTYSADEPESVRGPQHDGLWCDEVAAWSGPEALDLALMGLRLGEDPRAILTTTPKPTPFIKRLRAQSNVAITTGTTYENLSNLAAAFRKQVVEQYEGTRLGLQELMAQILDDNPDALWRREPMLDALRVPRGDLDALDLVRIVVAVDPAVSVAEGSAETGIIVVGLGVDGHLYVLADKSGRYTPEGWASQAIAAYHAYNADRIVGEVNNGGDLVERNVRASADQPIPFQAVHASRGKRIRAEPVAAIYERGKAHHVGAFPILEDQLCDWTPDDDVSPDRLDALVWGATALVLDRKAEPNVR